MAKCKELCFRLAKVDVTEITESCSSQTIVVVSLFCLLICLILLSSSIGVRCRFRLVTVGSLSIIQKHFGLISFITTTVPMSHFSFAKASDYKSTPSCNFDQLVHVSHLKSGGFVVPTCV